MKVKFKNGTIKKCTTPVEQKIMRNSEPIGWILLMNLVGETTSDEVDALITPDNISELTFIPEPIDGDGNVLPVIEDNYVVLKDYEKLSSSAIRYAEDTTQTRVEIQLSKGV